MKSSVGFFLSIFLIINFGKNSEKIKLVVDHINILLTLFSILETFKTKAAIGKWFNKPKRMEYFHLCKLFCYDMFFINTIKCWSFLIRFDIIYSKFIRMKSFNKFMNYCKSGKLFAEGINNN